MTSDVDIDDDVADENSDHGDGVEPDGLCEVVLGRLFMQVIVSACVELEIVPQAADTKCEREQDDGEWDGP